jgi:hypothetical protein
MRHLGFFFDNDKVQLTECVISDVSVIGLVK